MRRIYTELRGPGLLGPNAVTEFRSLVEGQHLVLQREPVNEKDPNAVIAITLMAQPVAYIAKETAAIVSPLMRAGRVITCRVTAVGRAYRYPQIVVDEMLRQDVYARELHLAGAHESMIRAIISGNYGRP